MDRCPQCTRPIELGSRFCEHCGTATPATSGGAGTSAPRRASSRELLLERVRKATLGLYDVRGEIGRGGMAAVYLAHDLRLNRKVALKVMLPGLSFTEGMAERFKLEARTAANLDHPNIVTIYAVEEIEELLFFAMKYVEGRALDTLLKDIGPLACDVTQYIIAQVSRALAYAHEEGVVHRDVKPGNVILDRRGLPVVTDFGIAKAGESTSLTQTGAIVGTPIYMSPEQWRGKRAIAASDQYALGIMAFEMLIGEPPFRGSPVELQLAHVTEAPRAPRTLRADVTEAMNAAVMRMLAKNPDDRFPTLHDVAAAMSASLPHDVTPIRHKLVEVGFLADGFGGAALPATPISPLPKRTVETSGPGTASRAPASPPPTPQKTSERTASRVPVDAPPERRTGAAPPPDPVPAGPTGMATVVEPVRRPTPTASSPRIVVPPRVSTVRITSAKERLTVGETAHATAEVHDEEGRALPERRVTWSVEPGGLVEVAPDGAVRALHAGHARLIASCEGIMSSVAIEIAPPEVVRTPTAPPRPAEPARRETPTPADTRRQRWPLVAGGVVMAAVAIVVAVLATKDAPAPVAQNDSVAISTDTGSTTTTTTTGQDTTAVAIPADTATTVTPPTGTGAPVASSIEIVNAPRVLIVPEELALRSRVVDENGQEMSVPVTWYSNNPAVAAIDQRRGIVRAGQPGVATIRARAGEVQSVVQIAVELPRLNTVEITNAPPQLREGEQVSLALRVIGENGPLSAAALGQLGMTPSWSSSRTDVAVVDLRSGRVTGVGAGTTSISLSVGQYSAQHSLTVLPRETAAPPPKTQYPDPGRGGTTPAPKTREQLIEEVTATIRSYARAVEARDLGAMQRLYPAMPAEDRRTWESFFRDAREITYEIGRISVEGSIADTDGSETLVVSERTLAFYSQAARRRQGPLAGQDRIRLQRAGDGWRIRRIE